MRSDDEMRKEVEDFSIEKLAKRARRETLEKKTIIKDGIKAWIW